jgi:Mlc titration factor MtfA (ptsG expression regulator)
MLHRRQGLPDGWRPIVERRVAVWRELDDEERELLASAADWLLRHKHWEAAHGFALDDDVTVTVAAQAALLVLRIGVDAYREVSAIVVHPTTVQSRGVHAGPVAGTEFDGVLPVLGEAHDLRGPVLLAWDRARYAARHPGRGENVVFHEFAHKIDMLDGLTDGTPPLPDRAAVRRWVAACTEPYEALREGEDRAPLDPYGATDPAEFFAVATEAFFDAPVELADTEPDLYAVLRDYFAQDPAERARRASPRA